MVSTSSICMLLLLALGSITLAGAQETPRGLTRKLLSPEEASHTVHRNSRQVVRSSQIAGTNAGLWLQGWTCQQECSNLQENGEIEAECCDCDGSLSLVDVLGRPVCVEASLADQTDVIEEILLLQGLDIKDHEQVDTALREFSSQAVSLSEFTKVEAGQLPLAGRERNLNREFAAKVKYNDKTRDVAYGVKRDHDAIANTQIGLVETRAGRLNEVSATTTIDRNAITGLPKEISSDVHKDTAINLAAVHFVPRVDRDSVGNAAESFVQPLVGGVGDTIFDAILG